MMMRQLGTCLAGWMLVQSAVGSAQQTAAAVSTANQPSTLQPDRLEQRLDRVLATLTSMQQQLDDSRRQIDELQRELRAARVQPVAEGSAAATTVIELQEHVQQLQAQDEVLQAEVKQHDQTKVESASKYPLKITGLLLFSSFLNDGAVNNIDLPILAIPRNATTAHGSVAATMRQTILGLEARGPQLWGASSSADVHVDFFGGMPYTDYTTSTGILRLRTAHARLEWPNHSLVAAFDAPLISPNQPTSYVGVGEPPFAWSGNLWVWAPQLQSINRANLGRGKAGFDFALIDPAAPGNALISGERQPNAGERSRQPAYESRISYRLPLLDRAFTVGAGGYYSRQTYYGSQHVDAWAATADWNFPFTTWLQVSGELYRGRALGGLGAGAFKDYLTDLGTGAVHSLNDEGAWSQLKLKMSRSVEANLGIGEDAGFSSQLRYYMDPAATDIYTNLARNRTVLANITYRPRSYLLFSAEYRNIYTWPFSGQVNTAQSLGLATGYSF